ncbi:hypothetical protein CASFOL_021567 [Castilleja foliolosa]|uniref:MATH domain-containing protein n=1 Tax=Castilleja foliolosa TaxID=1961234 RepID=A0ABD3CWX3_9LAMI
MAGVATDESGVGRLYEGVSSVQQQQRFESGEEALEEWRSLEKVENKSPSTSPLYWDDDDDGGPKPSDLYGKHTWKIENFSQINKRELRSNAFEVGGYKCHGRYVYILIYPQGCDVCNHLSLFLCVSHHDKLLPGWSHFAQFTMAVVNQDHKKSKYSDTLHRFWKKEHDWGWKKFLEISKVSDGYIEDDTLIIKAQVQVIRFKVERENRLCDRWRLLGDWIWIRSSFTNCISYRERADRPFRCLDINYRRELVRVYLTNVEQICRRFVEERRGRLVKLIEDKARWSSLRAFWMAMDYSSRRCMSREKTEPILKVVVKHFFIEKEVTSTLVMDSLYSGLKALEGQNNKGKKSKGKCLEAEELPAPMVYIDKDTFGLVGDLLLILERAAIEPLPPKDEKGPQNRTKDGSAGEEFNQDSIERDERRLTELGRRTIETFFLAHIFSKIEVAYQEADSLKKQEELIREEEAAELEQKARRGSTDKDKKSKKKQGKQKKNNRKGKDKGRDEKAIISAQDKIEEDIIAERESELVAESETVLEKSEAVEDISDVSDSIDFAPEILVPDSEDRNLSLVRWDADISEVHPPIEADSSGLSGVQNGSPSVVDDSSSTCSSDSVPSVVSVANKGTSSYRNQKSPNRRMNDQSKLISESADWVKEEPIQPVVLDARRSNDASESSNTVGSHAQPSVQSSPDRVVNGVQQKTEKKEVETESVHRSNSNLKAAAHAFVPLLAQQKSKPKIISPSNPVVVSKPSSYVLNEANNNNSMLSSSSSQRAATSKPVAEPQKLTTSKPKEMQGKADNNSSVLSSSSSQRAATSKPIAEPQKLTTSKPKEMLGKADNNSSVLSSSSSQRAATSKPIPEPQKLTTSKPKEMLVTADKHKPSIPPMPVTSRPLSAPLVPGPRPAVSNVSMVQTAPVLARSVSAAGRLGPEPTSTAYATQSYVPLSLRNTIIGGPVAGSSSVYSSVVNSSSHSYSHAPPSRVSTQLFSPRLSDQTDRNPIQPNLPFGMVNHREILQNRPVWIEQSNNVQNYNPVRSRQPDHLPSEFRSSSRHEGYQSPDEFPHLDIINDLLDEEHGIGMAAGVNSGYQGFGNGPHNLNRHYSFPGDPVMSGGPGPTCRFDRARSYDEETHNGYGGGSGRTYSSVRDMIPQQAGPGPGPGPYLNGQADSFVPNQWQMGGSDVQYLSGRNVGNDGGYPYHIPEYSNLGGGGMNGYNVYRRSNGH